MLFRSVPVAGRLFVFYAYLYNIVTISITVLFSVPIARTTATQERLEGDFRFAHMRLKSSAERVAMLHGEELERSIVDGRLADLIANMRVLIMQYFRLELMTSLRGVGGDFFGLAMAVLLVFSGMSTVIDIGDLATGLGYFRLFSSACQGLPEKLPVLSTMSGLLTRLMELHGCLLEAQSDSAATIQSTKAEVEFTTHRLAVRNLTFSTPAIASSPPRKVRCCYMYVGWVAEARGVRGSAAAEQSPQSRASSGGHLSPHCRASLPRVPAPPRTPD